jgi:hypothetical protein
VAFRDAGTQITGAVDFAAQLRGDLRRWSLGRTLAHQFSLAAKPAKNFATVVSSGPPHGLGERWQRYKVKPEPPPGLAAVKHAQQQSRAAPAPSLPRSNRSGPSSRGELYEYYKRMGMLELYFSLFPGS